MLPARLDGGYVSRETSQTRSVKIYSVFILVLPLGRNTQELGPSLWAASPAGLSRSAARGTAGLVESVLRPKSSFVSEGLLTAGD